MRTAFIPFLLLGALLVDVRPAAGQSIYEKDIAFALDELPKLCGHFFELKKIDWPAVSARFREEAKAAKTDQEHLVLLVRLVARLKDGHATVLPREKTKQVKWPEDPAGPTTGPGMFWCIAENKVHVKNSWATAQTAGVKPGMQVLRVDGKDVWDWLRATTAKRADIGGYSTEHQALAATCHWGLAGPVNSEMKLDLQDIDGNMLGVSVRRQRASYIPVGPAIMKNVSGSNDIKYTTLPSGYGYIHLRRTPADLPQQMDKVLTKLGNVPGLILDFRANGGGGFDHEAFMGRFIPAGKEMRFGLAYRSAGPNPYGGPIVVIVDAVTRSAGETGSGIFKEDGRAYLIGESPTAGSSSSKKTLELPSGLFALYVSVASNKGRFNGGKGIEGIGVPPHEIVFYDPKDLAAGVDTLTKRAEALIKDFPQSKVPYNPADFGWSVR